MKWTGILSLALTLGVAACGKDEPQEPVAVPAPAPAPPPPPARPAAPPAAQLGDDDIAVPEDFIEEATAEVTPANYKSKLDEIDKELAAETE
jgi:hypothetical protein